MCLAIPMKLISKNKDSGVVELCGVTYDINISLIPTVKINDYVIVHAGFAIEILDEAKALDTLNLFSGIADD